VCVCACAVKRILSSPFRYAKMVVLLEAAFCFRSFNIKYVCVFVSSASFNHAFARLCISDVVCFQVSYVSYVIHAVDIVFLKTKSAASFMFCVCVRALNFIILKYLRARTVRCLFLERYDARVLLERNRLRARV